MIDCVVESRWAVEGELSWSGEAGELASGRKLSVRLAIAEFSHVGALGQGSVRLWVQPFVQLRW